MRSEISGDALAISRGADDQLRDGKFPLALSLGSAYVGCCFIFKGGTGIIFLSFVLYSDVIDRSLVCASFKPDILC